jgi:hypothetical protein
VRAAALVLGILLAVAACKRREPRLPATPYPKAKLAYRVGNCVYMDLTHSGEADKGRCYGVPGEPMLAHDFDGNGTADLAVRRGSLLLIDTANDGRNHEATLDLGDVAGATQFVAGDFSGTASRPAPATVSVRRDQEGEHFAGRWRAEGPARFGVRRGECVDLDEDGDERPERHLCYAALAPIDQVLVGDWNGDGRDDLLLRRAACVFVDTKLDGTHTEKQCFGEGKGATDHFAGSWDGK